MWKRARPAEGTVVEKYLRARGYPGPLPLLLRYVTGKHPSDHQFHPVILAAAVRADDPSKIVGVHRTFLLGDGTGKALLEPAKMSLGIYAGRGFRSLP